MCNVVGIIEALVPLDFHLESGTIKSMLAHSVCNWMIDIL